MKQVAVIILNWNGAGLLRRYLPTVIAGTDDTIADVIVADNGSTDESLQILQQEFPQVQVLKFKENYGFAEGYNRAIEQTMYPYTVLLNSDVRTPQGWLNPLLDYMEAQPGVGAVMPKLLQDREDDKQMFEYAGAAGGYIDCHGYPYCRGRIFECVEEDQGQYDDGPKSVFWATGACLMVRSQLYQEVGGLDKDFFAHMEEIDLCWRIRLSGDELMMVPSSHVYHLGGGSLPQGNPRKTYYNFRNNLLLLHKNLPRREGQEIAVVAPPDGHAGLRHGIGKRPLWRRQGHHPRPLAFSSHAFPIHHPAHGQPAQGLARGACQHHHRPLPARCETLHRTEN